MALKKKEWLSFNLFFFLPLSCSLLQFSSLLLSLVLRTDVKVQFLHVWQQNYSIVSDHLGMCSSILLKVAPASPHSFHVGA